MSRPPVHATLLLHGGKHIESLWVRPLEGGRYKLAAIPFHAYNLSLGDVVSCRPDEDGAGLFIEQVLAKSGHRTLRVAFWAKEGANHPAAKSLVTFLREEGIAWDYNRVRLVSIDIPSEDVHQRVLTRLHEMPSDAEAEWEEADPQPDRNLDGTPTST